MEKSNTTPAQVQKELKGINYPASKQDLLDHIDKNGKNREVRSFLEKIPEKGYNSPVEVNKEIGKLKQIFFQNRKQSTSGVYTFRNQIIAAGFLFRNF